MSSHQRKRYVCSLNFVNIVMEKINVSKTFQMKDIIDCLPFNLQDHENIPVTTYKLTATIRNKVFNCKETVEPIELDEYLSINDDIYPCNGEDPEFCEPDHGHVITGDLRLIKNQKLRKLFTMGPTFREPKS